MRPPLGHLLNGYPIVAIAALPDRPMLKRDMSVVLVDRGPDEDNPYHPRYVVSTHAAGEEGWHNGVYKVTLAEARAEFASLWARGTR